MGNTDLIYNASGENILGQVGKKLTKQANNQTFAHDFKHV
jgi:hypothetical protein